MTRKIIVHRDIIYKLDIAEVYSALMTGVLKHRTDLLYTCLVK